MLTVSLLIHFVRGLYKQGKITESLHGEIYVRNDGEEWVDIYLSSVMYRLSQPTVPLAGRQDPSQTLTFLLALLRVKNIADIP